VKKFILMGAIAYLCTGCATNYTELAADEPHAKISFQRNEAGVKADNGEPMQGYELIDNPQCENRKKVAWFSWDKEFKETARFPATEKLHFHMHSVKNVIQGDWCYSYLGFKPEIGGEYVVMHNSCRAEVFDTSDGSWTPVTDTDVINGFECPK